MMSQSLILTDPLSSACWEKKRKREKKKKKRETTRVFFPPGPDTPYWLCHAKFSWLLGAIKGLFKGQSLNFICT
jgi:hypothetical protein